MPGSPDLNKKRTISDLIANQLKPPHLNDNAWYRVGVTEGYTGEGVGGTFIGLTFENGWDTDTTDNKAPWAFYLADDGEVRMRGQLDDASATDELVFTLPDGYRPQFSEPFRVTVSSGATGILWIDPDGSVRFVPDIV